MNKNLKRKFKYFSDLNWKFSDYIKNKKEAPARIKECPQKTEGEMMSSEEIEQWFLESVKVLRIIKEENENSFKSAHGCFLIDLEYLFSLDKIDEEALDFVNNLNNFSFYEENDE